MAASDASHPNRFMFTGREFDKDTGLYYYRARYYNPEIGRFLQTDPIGYGDGMNLYRYCKNSAVNCIDPSGLMTKRITVAFYDGELDPFNRSPFQKCAEGGDYSVAIDLRMPAEFYDSEDRKGMSTGQLRLEWIRQCLANLRDGGYEVTEIYFFDHGWDGIYNDSNSWTQYDEGGLSLGDEWYTPNGPTDIYPNDNYLKDFAEMLASVTTADDPTTEVYEGTTIHLRSCYGALIADRVAEWSNRKTTGFTEAVSSQNPANNNGVPYMSSGFYIEYGPNGEEVRKIDAGTYSNYYKR